MDREQLAALFDQHHQHLYRLSLRMLGHPTDAEDMLQDTFLKAWRATNRGTATPANAKAWLIRILVNCCRDKYRRRDVRKVVQTMDPTELPGGYEIEPSLVAKQTVRVALAQLEPRRRAVIIMHELESRTPADIGAILGMAAVTVRWHLSKGRKALAKWLKNKEVTHGLSKTASTEGSSS